MSSSDILVSAENVGKKFCRSLKRSLWYGVKNAAGALNPFAGKSSGRAVNHSPALRKDEFWALEDVSFELRRGECLGLLGYNGAGKSTLLKILNGLYPPDAGRITMRGRVGAMIELNAGFNPILTGRENIFNQGALLGFSKEEMKAKFDDIVEFSEVGKFLDMPVQNYSSGMRVRLGFAVAAQMEPDVLILDEVLAVGDVAFRHKCMSRMETLLNNAAVIFVSHSMPQVQRVSTRGLFLEKGRATGFDDVGKAIKHYLESGPERKMISVAAQGAEMLAATIEGDSKPTDGGESVVSIDEGADLTLALKIRLSPGQKFSLCLTFWNQELIPALDVFLSSPRFSLVTDAQGFAHVRFRLKRVTLNAGRYSLRLSATPQDGIAPVIRHELASSLVITRGRSSGAVHVLYDDGVELLAAGV